MIILVETNTSYFGGKINHDISILDNPHAILPFPQIKASGAGNKQLLIHNTAPM